MQVSEPYPCHGGNFASLFLRVGLLNFSYRKVSDHLFMYFFPRDPKRLMPNNRQTAPLRSCRFYFGFSRQKSRRCLRSCKRWMFLSSQNRLLLAKCLQWGTGNPGESRPRTFGQFFWYTTRNYYVCSHIFHIIYIFLVYHSIAVNSLPSAGKSLIRDTYTKTSCLQQTDNYSYKSTQYWDIFKLLPTFSWPSTIENLSFCC